jgi:4-amino-4-deoxy-L-arabinose transferase-like glycosyltransferase
LPTADQNRLLRLPVWLWLLGLLVLHLGFCAARFAPAITCADANGYWAQGTRLAQTGRTWFRPESDIQHIGAHWLVTEDGRYFARYPAGLPVLVAAVTKLFGYRFSVWINPVLSILALVGVYQLTRRLAGPRWALLAPLFLALNPIYSRHALQNDSHMAIVCLLAWGLALLLAWSESGSLWRLFLGSVLLGAIPAVRYPEALYALGIGVFLIWRSLGKPRPYLHCLVGLGGALLPLVPLMIHNHYAFGAFWNTAYSLTNEQTGFGWNYFTQHAMQYLSNLQGTGLGILFALGLGASAAMCAYPKRRAEGAMFLLLIVPSTLLYMAYYWAPRMMTAGTISPVQQLQRAPPCWFASTACGAACKACRTHRGIPSSAGRWPW